LTRLDEVFGRRLTVVVADAGFGKSTLLASWASEVECAWYTVTGRDESLSSLARGVVDAMRAWMPEPPEELVAALVAPAASEREELRRAESIASLLCGALHARLNHDLVIVLDDLHEVGAAAAPARLIESLVRHASASVHVVLASREGPPFPIQRLRGQGHVLEFAGSDLAFTVEEVAALLAASSVGADSGLTSALHEATGGWPAGVRLAIEALRARPAASDPVGSLVRLGAAGGPLYAYLAEEIFAREPPDVRELLRRVAPLERFTTGLCETIGVRRAATTIAHLLERGLFLESRDGWCSLHTLARDFALTTWPLAPEEAAAVHRRAARWLESHGRLEEALRSLAAAADYNELARVLAERGAGMVASGAADSVVRFSDLLPEGLRDASVDQVVGEAHAVRGDPDRAVACFRRAVGDAKLLPPALAWRMAEAYNLRDELADVIRVYEQTRMGAEDTSDEALLLAWTSSAQMRRGDIEAAGTLAGRALDAATACGDDRALAAAHTAFASAAQAAGDARGSETHLRRALDAAERAGDILQLARIRNNRGSRLLDEGSYREAIEELEICMGLAELAGLPSLLALSLMNRGLCHWCLGRLDEARSDYEAAIALYRPTETDEIAYALIGRGDVYRERGDLALARAAYEEGLAVAERSGDRQALVPGLYQLAKVLVDEEPEEAARLAERAVAYGWPDWAWALNAAGWIALARGDRERAADAAEEAATVARARKDRFGLAESLELKTSSAPEPTQETHCLEEALAIWRELGNPVHEATAELALARLATGPEAQRLASRAERRLRSLGVRVSPTVAAGLLRMVAQGTDAPVAIETLGGFRVLRAGEPVGLAEWQSKKARDLLKILVARRGRPTPRELLMEALWGDDDPRRLANRLSVALATLRAVLDPERAFDSERFVTADKAAVRLVLPNVLVDVEEFLHDADAGLALRREGKADEAGARLAAAEAAYAGDFLEEDAYADWAVPLREEARAAYVAVTRARAEDAAAAGDRDAAARSFLRVLEHDRYDEHAHLGLVSTLERAGRHGEARRSYRAYVARMREIGVEAAAFPSSL
jgi:ATP/maltotriose-dependent transcriptional regulator MalT/DNA-binding SARP family transcriptional activator